MPICIMQSHSYAPVFLYHQHRPFDIYLFTGDVGIPNRVNRLLESVRSPHFQSDFALLYIP